MRYIKLGNSGLDISPIALGCMTYGQPDRGHPTWSLGEEVMRARTVTDNEHGPVT